MKQENIMRVNELACELKVTDNQWLWSELVELLQPIVKSIVYSASIKYQAYNISHADLEEEVACTIIKAVRCFNADKGVPFTGYFTNAAKNQCRELLRQAKASNRAAMTTYSSIYATASTNKDGDEVAFVDTLADSCNTECEVMSRLESIPAINQALATLNEKDRMIISLYISYSDKKERKAAIDAYLGGVKPATLRKAVQRARDKFKIALVSAGYMAEV